MNEENKEIAIDKITKEKISKTYREYAQEFIDKNNIFNVDEISGVFLFAEHLDGNNVLTNELTILAIQQARKYDRELLMLFIDEVGLEKAREFAQKVVGNHRHTKVCPEEVQPAKEEQKKEEEKSE